ncbi:MAG: DMT family transporter [Aestuariivirga sp.]
MTTTKTHMDGSEWGMLLLLAAIWGASFLFFAIALRELPVFTIVFLRVSLAAAALWVILLITGTPVTRQPAMWRNFMIMGLINNVIPFSLIVWGQQEVAPGLAAILNATTPFFTVLIANSFLADERLTALKLSGAAVGLLGVAAMMGADALIHLGQSVWHQLAILLAAVFYAVNTVFARRFAGLLPLMTAAGQTTCSTLLLFPLVLLIDRPWQLSMPGGEVVASILALSLLCTALAYVLYFAIVKSAGATNIALVTFLVPVSAVILGAAVLGEHIGWQHGAGMLAIALGLALIDGRLFRRKLVA